MTSVRITYHDSGSYTLRRFSERIPMLTSYAYLPPFEKEMNELPILDWTLDSGAFSAFNSGVSIDVRDYAETCRRLLSTYDSLVEIYALDVIGDWRASLRNTEQLWRLGVPAIPTYHVGEPEDYLLGIARDYDKIAIGGAVGMETKAKTRWALSCISRVWPHGVAVHGFGFGSRYSMERVPFHSTDATSWESGPHMYGRWLAYGRVRGLSGRQDLRADLEAYLKMERELSAIWSIALEVVSERYERYRRAVEDAR